MSKLNVDQKTIYELFSGKRADFLIPDYQRPYAWEEEQCQTLWDDIFTFAFPENNADNFNDLKDEYFLGSIVTYKNEKTDQSEVIDGQQRLTTLMLLLRAFYDKFANMQDQSSQLTKKRIESCIWKTNAFGEAVKSELKIDSEVATDDDKDGFLELLKTGNIKVSNHSKYINNYKFFQMKIDVFLQSFPSYFPYLPARILGNCILLPIEADSQDTALRIFSTLNDRGLPLSDADIFKAQFYKFYNKHGKKDEFIKNWKKLEKVCNEVFEPNTGTPMDELFTRYMYYLRAKEGIKSSTTEALRKFYERNKYQYLNSEDTIVDLQKLANFWESIKLQDTERFSEDILKKLYILHYSPNGMWQHMTSAYFLQNKDHNDLLEESYFIKFLNKITAFIFTFAVTSPGVNALRTPAYDEMINIVNRNAVTFTKYKFNESSTKTLFDTYIFTNQRNITRSIITWYAYTFLDQPLLALNEVFHLEHIFSKKRYQMENGIKNINNIESLGNKILLEESINIRASDYRFKDKQKIYSGEQRRGKNQRPSQITEIGELIRLNEFEEQNIIDRSQLILLTFFNFLRNENLFLDS